MNDSEKRGLSLVLLAMSLLGCATETAAPHAGPGIARISAEELARLLPRPDPRLPLEDLIRLSREGTAAKDIIARIRETGSRYELSASQAIELHRQGVNAEVLDFIQSAREQELRDRMAEEINQRERRHAEELGREQELRRNLFYYDPWWPGQPGWNYGYPFFPHGSFYWRR